MVCHSRGGKARGRWWSRRLWRRRPFGIAGASARRLCVSRCAWVGTTRSRKSSAKHFPMSSWRTERSYRKWSFARYRRLPLGRMRRRCPGWGGDNLSIPAKVTRNSQFEGGRRKCTARWDQLEWWTNKPPRTTARIFWWSFACERKDFNDPACTRCLREGKILTRASPLGDLST